MAAKWSEFDLRDPDNATWTKPSHHTKQKRTHGVALHPEAVSLLLDVKTRPNADAVYVFPGNDGAPLAGIKTAWRNIMVRSRIKDFRIHDLRHTFASRLIDEGASLAEIGALFVRACCRARDRTSRFRLEVSSRSDPVRTLADDSPRIVEDRDVGVAVPVGSRVLKGIVSK
jgi:integrase